jgi:hypothetical protein
VEICLHIFTSRIANFPLHSRPPKTGTMKIKVNKKNYYKILNAEIVNACTYRQYNPQFFFGLTYGPSHNVAIKKSTRTSKSAEFIYNPKICVKVFIERHYSYLCTYDLYSAVHNVLDACISSMRASGRGLGRGYIEFFGPCKMASS